MQSVLHTGTNQANVSRVVEDVFRTMLGFEVSLSNAEWSADRELTTAVVHFAGVWMGAVLLECAPEQTFELTSRLMGIPKPDSVNDDVRDAMGEIANMIGGNLKSVLTPGVALSMPSLIQGTDYIVRMCGNSVVSRSAFTGKIGTFWVTLVEMPSDRPRPIASSPPQPVG